MTKGSGKTKMIGLIIMLIVLFAGIVTTWALYGENIGDNTNAIVELEEEGCKPIQPLKQRVNLIEYRMDEFSKEQKSIKADTKEILLRLPRLP